MSPAGPAAGQLPVDRLSAFGRLLVTTDGTVTTLLEELLGGPIRLAGLRHGGPAPAGALAALADGPGPGTGPVLTRSTQLVAAGSGTTLVRARSVLSTDALPGPVHRDLTTTSEPIGRVLRRRRIETFRELLCVRVLFGGERADPLDQAHAWARAPGSGRGPDCGPNRGPDRTVTGAQRVYRVFIGGRPAMVVGEVFTAACLHLGDAPAPGRHQSAAKEAT
ncbi:hypothetical protein [Kitasatospora purpeofusca]|uniref:chorismate--pyruvate lyase family protein n=1 Tax=Kitasatospora purpeofusca TaxID=67352 RepID=UPI002A59AA44|nr:hypothetical protein [Kitasatospora purpeofusca]MDY0816734.1 hypothetical protein [Kitasatospora purpeofusca]